MRGGAAATLGGRNGPATAQLIAAARPHVPVEENLQLDVKSIAFTAGRSLAPRTAHHADVDNRRKQGRVSNHGSYIFLHLPPRSLLRQWQEGR